jgi:hypothetical protein
VTASNDKGSRSSAGDGASRFSQLSSSQLSIPSRVAHAHLGWLDRVSLLPRWISIGAADQRVVDAPSMIFFSSNKLTNLVENITSHKRYDLNTCLRNNAHQNHIY